ncbi:MAG TPA: hypothetical protein PKZ97_17185, partial [Azospirillaceae bacterium]|nr:hypothetical protein [Azospirillaceae bacterium]
MPSDALLIENEILRRLPDARRAPADLTVCRDIGALLRRLDDPARWSALPSQLLDGHPDEAAAAAGLADGLARAGMG